jgi:hypothetical protein
MAIQNAADSSAAKMKRGAITLRGINLARLGESRPEREQLEFRIPVITVSMVDTYPILYGWEARPAQSK